MIMRNQLFTLNCTLTKKDLPQTAILGNDDINKCVPLWTTLYITKAKIEKFPTEEQIEKIRTIRPRFCLFYLLFHSGGSSLPRANIAVCCYICLTFKETRS